MLTVTSSLVPKGETIAFVPQAPLFEVELFEIISEECVFDGFEDDTYVLCVCGAGVVCVKGFLMPHVVLLVHLQDELFRRFGITLRPCEGQNQSQSVYLEEITL